LTAAFTLPIDFDAVVATYDPDRHRPTKRWWVSEHDTQWILGPVIDWVVAAGDQVTVAHDGVGMNVEPGQVQQLVFDGLGQDLMVTLKASPGPGKLRQLNARPFGDVSVGLYEPELPRTEQLAELVGVLTLVGPDLRTGWIQEAKTTTGSRYSLLTETPPEHAWLQRIGGSNWWLFQLEDDHVSTPTSLRCSPRASWP